MLSSVFKTKKLVFVRKGTLFMTAETEAIKVQILSTGNAEILLEENDFLIVKWIKPEIKYSMAAYQYGKTGMANNYPWECSLTEEQIAFFLEHINAAVEYFKSKHHYFHLEVKEVSYENIVSIDEHGIKFSDLHWLTYKEYDIIYSYMKYTNVGSYSTALANGMKKVKEYQDPKNTISYVYAITREEWKKMKEN